MVVFNPFQTIMKTQVQKPNTLMSPSIVKYKITVHFHINPNMGFYSRTSVMKPINELKMKGSCELLAHNLSKTQDSRFQQHHSSEKG